MDDSPPNKSRSVDSPPILACQSTALRPGKAVTVGEYPDAAYASIDSGRLSAEGIDNHVLNANVNGLGIPYRGWTSVELQVHEADADRAREILRADMDDMEPAADFDETPTLDDEGKPLNLVVAAAFESVREMREAITVLASARIRGIGPKLVKRGDAPAGEGKRFVLRVDESDLERAQSLIEQARADSDEEDEPRCPKCNSWRVYPASRTMKIILAFFGMGKWPPVETECLACKYRAAPEEFEK
jgi:hypothetical protein